MLAPSHSVARVAARGSRMLVTAASAHSAAASHRADGFESTSAAANAAKTKQLSSLPSCRLPLPLAGLSLASPRHPVMHTQQEQPLRRLHAGLPVFSATELTPEERIRKLQTQLDECHKQKADLEARNRTEVPGNQPTGLLFLAPNPRIEALNYFIGKFTTEIANLKSSLAADTKRLEDSLKRSHAADTKRLEDKIERLEVKINDLAMRSDAIILNSALERASDHFIEQACGSATLASDFRDRLFNEIQQAKLNSPDGPHLTKFKSVLLEQGVSYDTWQLAWSIRKLRLDPAHSPDPLDFADYSDIWKKLTIKGQPLPELDPSGRLLDMVEIALKVWYKKPI